MFSRVFYTEAEAISSEDDERSSDGGNGSSESVLASAVAMDVQVRVTSARAEEKVERLMRITEAFPSKSSPKPITQKADLEN